MNKHLSGPIAKGLVIGASTLLFLACSSDIDEQVSGAETSMVTTAPDRSSSEEPPASRLGGTAGFVQVVDDKEFFVSSPKQALSFAFRQSAEFIPLSEAERAVLPASDIVANYPLQADKSLAPLELAFGTISDSVLSAPNKDGEIDLVLQDTPVWVIVESGVLVYEQYPETTDPPTLSTVVRIVDATTGQPILEFTDPTNRVIG